MAALTASPARTETTETTETTARAREPRRRSPLELEADRRSQERKLRIGGQIRDARRRRKWSQDDLGSRAGVERSKLSRLERSIGPLELDALERVALALGLPLAVSLGRDLQAPDVADAGHLGMQELVLRLARAAGFDRRVELATRPAEPWRSADVALLREATHEGACVECWNSIGDVGAAMRSSMRKQAELEAAAVARWGGDGRVGLVWVVRATARNRKLLEAYPEVFATRFAGSSRAWVKALTQRGRVPSEAGLVWCDVGATRLFEWRRPARG